MVLTETFGQTNIPNTGVETTLFDVSNLNQYWATIFVNNASMALGDTYTLKVYVKDSQQGTLQLLYSKSFTGSYAEAFFIAPVTSTEYKITMTWVAGVSRTFNWCRYNA